MIGKPVKYYIVSGIGPGSSGVGRLMRELLPKAHSRGFKVVVYDYNYPLRSYLRNKKFFSFLAALFLTFSQRIYFFFKIRSIFGAKILFIHPQTAGMHNLFRLVKKNKIYFYVMDNSFFCMQSYNTHPIHGSECLQCIISPDNADPACSPFPLKTTKEKEVESLKKIRIIAKKIIFLAQNRRQEELIRLVFGGAQTHIVGMDTGEFQFLRSIQKSDLNTEQSIVYHGATHLAKGVGYFISLAERIPGKKFIVPDSRFKVEQCIGRPVEVNNIQFIPCSWETGLGQLVSEADLVVNPSLWSAPIEGALIKSFLGNPSVATVATQFGYEGEVFEKSRHLRLDLNPDVAAHQLVKYLDVTCQQSSSREIISRKDLHIPSGLENIFDIMQVW
jgi:hypothetical protein